MTSKSELGQPEQPQGGPTRIRMIPRDPLEATTREIALRAMNQPVAVEGLRIIGDITGTERHTTGGLEDENDLDSRNLTETIDKVETHKNPFK